MNRSPSRLSFEYPGSAGAGPRQAAISYSRGSSQPRDPTQVSCIAVRVFITWATNLFAHVFHIYVFKVVTSVDSGSHHRVGSLHKLNIFLRPSISISLWPIQYQFLSNISEMAIGFNYIWNIISVSCSVVPDSLRPHRLQPTRLLCPWDFPSKDTGVGCHFFSRGSSQPRDRTQVSRTAGIFFTNWATREVIYGT